MTPGSPSKALLAIGLGVVILGGLVLLWTVLLNLFLRR
jgi:hypothetical protein